MCISIFRLRVCSIEQKGLQTRSIGRGGPHFQKRCYVPGWVGGGGGRRVYGLSTLKKYQPFPDNGERIINVQAKWPLDIERKQNDATCLASITRVQLNSFFISDLSSVTVSVSFSVGVFIYLIPKMVFFFSSVLSALFMFRLYESRNIFPSLRTPKMVWWHLRVSVFRLINSSFLLKSNLKQTLFIVHSLQYLIFLMGKKTAQLWVGVVSVFSD